MTDKDVERELAENEQRAEEAAESHEGGFVKGIEGLFEPIIEFIEDLDSEDAERARENDADQRPD